MEDEILETLPLSLLNDFLYCPRRAALKEIEGLRSENKHTVLGDLVHDHADLPGYDLAKGVTLLRALPVWSERLGLSGKCDVVEVHPSGEASQTDENRSGLPAPHSALGIPHSALIVPVEYKKGKRRAFENDDAQLCAQGLCLEEMFGRRIEQGAVFHAASKRRREVGFTIELRALVERSLGELRNMIDAERVPPPVFKPACEECSLFEICLPKAVSAGGRAERLARQLFQT